jgi:hypothetical protein
MPKCNFFKKKNNFTIFIKKYVRFLIKSNGSIYLYCSQEIKKTIKNKKQKMNFNRDYQLDYLKKDE